jgi:hypothetical protein
VKEIRHKKELETVLSVDAATARVRMAILPRALHFPSFAQ